MNPQSPWKQDVSRTLAAPQKSAEPVKTYRVVGVSGIGNRDIRASHVPLITAKAIQVAMFCEGRFLAVLIQDESL